MSDHFVWQWGDEDEAQEVWPGYALERLYEFAIDGLVSDDERGPFLTECRDLIARELTRRRTP